MTTAPDQRPAAREPAGGRRGRGRRPGRGLLLGIAVVAVVATTGLVGSTLQRPATSPLGATGPIGPRPTATGSTGATGSASPTARPGPTSSAAVGLGPAVGGGAVHPPPTFTPTPTGPRPGAAEGVGIASGGTLQFDPPSVQESYLAAAEELGATWLRFDFTWSDIQRSDAAHYDWARYDDLVARAQKHGMSVLAMIGYAPFWARDPQCAGSDKCRPRDPAEYGRFAGAVAARYAPRGVHAFEIWNEPNIIQFFQPAADAAYYTRMLKAASVAIRAADRRAVVVSGGTAPAATGGGNLAPLDFVSQLYAAGGKGTFDVLGHHPYCYAGSFDCPGTPEVWSAWTQMNGTPTSLRGLMAAHGDGGKKIWATEFGAPTSGEAAVDEQHQAKMLATGVRMFSRYSWGGPLFLYSLKDRGTNPADREDWFGVIRADGSRKPSFGTVRTALAAVKG